MKIILSYLIKPEIIEYFNKKGIEVIKTMPFSVEYKSALLHPDIQCFYDKGVLYTSKNLTDYYNNFFSNIIPSNKNLSEKYPDDALFNCLKMENRFFCNTKYIDNVLYEHLKNNYEIIHVNQGYTNCSSLYIGKNIVLTSDKGMESVFLKHGYTVVFCDNKNIILKDYKNGFIGGCAVKTDEEIVFFGKLENEFEKIKNLLKENQINFKEFDFPLEDFGSGIVI